MLILLKNKFLCVGKLFYLAIITAFLFGCTAGKHGWTTSKYQGVMLPSATEDGEERLRLEKGFDNTINTFVSTYGQPDYLLVESTDSVKLFYLKEDRMYSFIRNWSSNSNVSIIDGIPNQYANWFKADDIKLLYSMRGRKSGIVMEDNKDVSNENSTIINEKTEDKPVKTRISSPQQNNLNDKQRSFVDSIGNEAIDTPVISRKLPREFINCADKDFNFEDLKYYEEYELSNAYCYCMHEVREFSKRGTSIIKSKNSLLEANVWVDDPQYKSLDKEYKTMSIKIDTASGNASRIERILKKDFQHGKAPLCKDSDVVQLFK